MVIDLNFFELSTNPNFFAILKYAINDTKLNRDKIINHL